MNHCLICQNEIEPFISFGKMPIANGFLSSEQFEHEYFFELKAGYCSQCHMVQLTELVDPSKLFHENYAYFSSISVRMAQHFKDFAEMVQLDYLPENEPFVVEIGSNDGIMLQNFAKQGIRHLGVEPSSNVAQVAIDKGINTTVRFFNEQTGGDLLREYGEADAVLGANVICHLPNIESVIKGILKLLTEKGVFIFEEPYMGDILEKTSYDQIYDEHVFYFSLHSLENLFKQHGMEIIDVLPQNVHGGSMRYVVARKGARSVKETVHLLREKENYIGVTDPASYQRFKDAVYQSRDRLYGLLADLKSKGKRVVAYGATSKSTTVTNFCQIGPDLIEFISDTTPGKQSKFSPGVHIPVLPYDKFKEKYPDYALLFAWNHGEEIIAKEQEFRQHGGKFILYVPEVKVLE
jgi:methylation protein EvaC